MRRFLLALLTVACSTAGLLSPDERRDLARAVARWNARSFADYSYEIRTSCFCAPEVNRWTRVRVVGGVVVGAEPVVPDPRLPITTLAYWQPIDSLFPLIARMGRESRDSYDDIEVQFDHALGYPTHIAINMKAHIADGGAVYSLREVRPIE